MPIKVVNPDDPLERHGVFVVDTHPLVWFLADADGPKLSARARRAFQRVEDGEATLVILIIVLAELVWISEKGRIGVTIPEAMEYAKDTGGVVVAPLRLPELEEVIAAGPGLEMHDRFVVATAKVWDAAIVTNDPEIAASGLVEVVW